MLRDHLAKPLSIALLCAASWATAAELRPMPQEPADGRCAAPAEAPPAPPPASAVDLTDYTPLREIEFADAPDANEMAWKHYFGTVFESLRHSSDAHDLLAATVALILQDNDDTDRSDTARALLTRAVAAAPNDALVQWFAYEIASRLSLPLAADALTTLQRLEPANGAVWLPALHNASPVGIDRALARLAASTRFEPHNAAAAKLLSDALRRFPADDLLPALDQEVGPGLGVDDAPDALAMFGILSLGMVDDDASVLVAACRIAPDKPTARGPDCAAVGRLLSGGNGSIGVTRAGFDTLRVSQTYTAEDERSARNQDWVFDQFKHLPDDDSAVRGLGDMRVWLSGRSEREIMATALQRANVPLSPPDEWVDPQSPFSAEQQNRDAAAAAALRSGAKRLP